MSMIRLKAPGGTGGWIVEPVDPEAVGMSAVFVEKTTTDPADTSELEAVSFEFNRAPYIELGVNAKTISQMRFQAGWRV